MKQGIILIICIFIISLTPAEASDITLITDNFWSMMIDEELHQSDLSQLLLQIKEILPFHFSDTVRIDGQRIERRIIDLSDGSADISKISKSIEGASGIIILSPMFAVYGCELAEQNPGLQIFAPCPAPPSECSGENIFYYVFDYSHAFYDAGLWAARKAPEVSAMFYTGQNVYKGRIDAFKQGWQSERALDELSIIEIRSLERINEQTIEDFISFFSGEKGLAAVFAGPGSHAVLEELDGGNADIMTENMLLWRYSGYDIAASVEMSPEMILSGIINSISINSYKTVTPVKAEFFLHHDE